MGINEVWSEYSMDALWVANERMFLHAEYFNSGLTVRMWDLFESSVYTCQISPYYMAHTGSNMNARILGGVIFMHWQDIHPCIVKVNARF